MHRILWALGAVAVTACSTPGRVVPAAGHPGSPETAVAALPPTAGILTGATTATAAIQPAPVDHSMHHGHTGHGGHP